MQYYYQHLHQKSTRVLDSIGGMPIINGLTSNQPILCVNHGTRLDFYATSQAWNTDGRRKTIIKKTDGNNKKKQKSDDVLVGEATTIGMRNVPAFLSPAAGGRSYIPQALSPPRGAAGGMLESGTMNFDTMNEQQQKNISPSTVCLEGGATTIEPTNQGSYRFLVSLPLYGTVQQMKVMLDPYYEEDNSKTGSSKQPSGGLSIFLFFEKRNFVLLRLDVCNEEDDEENEEGVYPKNKREKGKNESFKNKTKGKASSAGNNKKKAFQQGEMLTLASEEDREEEGRGVSKTIPFRTMMANGQQLMCVTQAYGTLHNSYFDRNPNQPAEILCCSSALGVVAISCYYGLISILNFRNASSSGGKKSITLSGETTSSSFSTTTKKASTADILLNANILLDNNATSHSDGGHLHAAKHIQPAHVNIQEDNVSDIAFSITTQQRGSSSDGPLGGTTTTSSISFADGRTSSSDQGLTVLYVLATDPKSKRQRRKHVHAYQFFPVTNSLVPLMLMQPQNAGGGNINGKLSSKKSTLERDEGGQEDEEQAQGLPIETTSSGAPLHIAGTRQVSHGSSIVQKDVEVTASMLIPIPPLSAGGSSSSSGADIVDLGGVCVLGQHYITFLSLRGGFVSSNATSSSMSKNLASKYQGKSTAASSSASSFLRVSISSKTEAIPKIQCSIASSQRSKMFSGATTTTTSSALVNRDVVVATASTSVAVSRGNSNNSFPISWSPIRTTDESSTASCSLNSDGMGHRFLVLLNNGSVYFVSISLLSSSSTTLEEVGSSGISGQTETIAVHLHPIPLSNNNSLGHSSNMDIHFPCTISFLDPQHAFLGSSYSHSIIFSLLHGEVMEDCFIENHGPVISLCSGEQQRTTGESKDSNSLGAGTAMGAGRNFCAAGTGSDGGGGTVSIIRSCVEIQEEGTLPDVHMLTGLWEVGPFLVLSFVQCCKILTLPTAENNNNSISSGDQQGELAELDEETAKLFELQQPSLLWDAGLFSTSSSSVKKENEGQGVAASEFIVQVLSHAIILYEASKKRGGHKKKGTSASSQHSPYHKVKEMGMDCLLSLLHEEEGDKETRSFFPSAKTSNKNLTEEEISHAAFQQIAVQFSSSFSSSKSEKTTTRSHRIAFGLLALSIRSTLFVFIVGMSGNCCSKIDPGTVEDEDALDLQLVTKLHLEAEPSCLFLTAQMELLIGLWNVKDILCCPNLSQFVFETSSFQNWVKSDGKKIPSSSSSSSPILTSICTITSASFPRSLSLVSFQDAKLTEEDVDEKGKEDEKRRRGAHDFSATSNNDNSSLTMMDGDLDSFSSSWTVQKRILLIGCSDGTLYYAREIPTNFSPSLGNATNAEDVEENDKEGLLSSSFSLEFGFMRSILLGTSPVLLTSVPTPQFAASSPSCIDDYQCHFLVTLQHCVLCTGDSPSFVYEYNGVMDTSALDVQYPVQLASTFLRGSDGVDQLRGWVSLAAFPSQKKSFPSSVQATNTSAMLALYSRGDELQFVSLGKLHRMTRKVIPESGSVGHLLYDEWTNCLVVVVQGAPRDTLHFYNATTFELIDAKHVGNAIPSLLEDECIVAIAKAFLYSPVGTTSASKSNSAPATGEKQKEKTSIMSAGGGLYSSFPALVLGVAALYLEEEEPQQSRVLLYAPRHALLNQQQQKDEKLVPTGDLVNSPTFRTSGKQRGGSGSSPDGASSLYVNIGGEKETKGGIYCISGTSTGKLLLGVNAAVEMLSWSTNEQHLVTECLLFVGFVTIGIQEIGSASHYSQRHEFYSSATTAGGENAALRPKHSHHHGGVVFCVADMRHSVRLMSIHPIDDSLEILAFDPHHREVLDMVICGENVVISDEQSNVFCMAHPEISEQFRRDQADFFLRHHRQEERKKSMGGSATKFLSSGTTGKTVNTVVIPGVGEDDDVADTLEEFDRPGATTQGTASQKGAAGGQTQNSYREKFLETKSQWHVGDRINCFALGNFSNALQQQQQPALPSFGKDGATSTLEETPGRGTSIPLKGVGSSAKQHSSATKTTAEETNAEVLFSYELLQMIKSVTLPIVQSSSRLTTSQKQKNLVGQGGNVVVSTSSTTDSSALLSRIRHSFYQEVLRYFVGLGNQAAPIISSSDSMLLEGDGEVNVARNLAMSSEKDVQGKEVAEHHKRSTTPKGKKKNVHHVDPTAATTQVSSSVGAKCPTASTLSLSHRRVEEFITTFLSKKQKEKRNEEEVSSSSSFTHQQQEYCVQLYKLCRGKVIHEILLNFFSGGASGGGGNVLNQDMHSSSHMMCQSEGRDGSSRPLPSASLLPQSILFGTSTGAIGSLKPLSQVSFQFLTAFQAAMLSTVPSIGHLNYLSFLSPYSTRGGTTQQGDGHDFLFSKNDNHNNGKKSGVLDNYSTLLFGLEEEEGNGNDATSSSQGFILGDIIEAFLDLPNPSKVLVVQRLNQALPQQIYALDRRMKGELRNYKGEEEGGELEGVVEKKEPGAEEEKKGNKNSGEKTTTKNSQEGENDDVGFNFSQQKKVSLLASLLFEQHEEQEEAMKQHKREFEEDEKEFDGKKDEKKKKKRATTSESREALEEEEEGEEYPENNSRGQKMGAGIVSMELLTDVIAAILRSM